jgi:hypothetical protein
VLRRLRLLLWARTSCRSLEMSAVLSLERGHTL